MSSSKRFSKPILAIALIVIVVLVSAVGYYFATRAPTVGPSATSAGTTTTSVAGPTTLIVDKSAELQSVDPAFDYEYAGWEILENVYQTLVYYDKTNTSSLTGVLAESWTQSPDGMTYTFKLRQGVKFSNGDPFDANAVKYSFDRVIKMNQAPSWILSQDMNPDSVKVIDPYTVEIDLTAPYAPFLYTMATATASIVDPKVVEAHGGVVPNSTNPWMDSNAVGTSPFMLQEWIKGDHLTLVRNPYYWGTPAPLEKVIIYYKSSVQTRLLDIKSGFAQIAVIDVNHVPEVNGTEGIVVQQLGMTYHIDFIYFNTKRLPFNITKVRQAVTHAINYDAIRFGINHGLTIPYLGPLPHGFEGYDESMQPYTYDPDLAKRLLAEAGFPDGKGLPTINYLYYARDASVALIAQEIQQDLANLGMDVKLIGVSFPTYMNIGFSEPNDPSIPEMGWTEWYPDYASPDDYVVPFTNPQFPPVGWNPAYYVNPTVTDLISKAPYELDAAKRVQMYHQITQIMYDDAPYAWLGQFVGYYVYRDNVHGVWNYPVLGESYDFSTIYLTPP